MVVIKDYLTSIENNIKPMIYGQGVKSYPSIYYVHNRIFRSITKISVVSVRSGEVLDFVYSYISPNESIFTFGVGYIKYIIYNIVYTEAHNS